MGVVRARRKSQDRQGAFNWQPGRDCSARLHGAWRALNLGRSMSPVAGQTHELLSLLFGPSPGGPPEAISGVFRNPGSFGLNYASRGLPLMPCGLTVETSSARTLAWRRRVSGLEAVDIPIMDNITIPSRAHSLSRIPQCLCVHVLNPVDRLAVVVI